MTDFEAPRAAYDLLLGRLGELWLKGRNRNDFYDRLKRNLQGAMSAELRGVQVQGSHGRLFVKLTDPADVDRALAICRDTPGLSSVSPVLRVPTDLEGMKRAALDLVQAEWAGREGTFAVDARRTFKGFPLTSPQIAREVGGAVQDATDRTVDLSAPTLTLGVEVNEDRTHLWTHTQPAPGGLPVGSAGRVLLLLSGGIDSPVAGYLAQKRGAALDAVYFHSPPFISAASRDKVETLARRLATRQNGMRLHVVHFTEIQKAIKAAGGDRLTVLLYRRFMYRIAARLAKRRKCRALCTGENLGQVASQTLENLTVVDRLTDLLTLRPLITFDKLEIMAIARRIGTYDTSVLPYDDCCTLFVPRNPAIKASIKSLEKAERRLEVEALVEQALAATEEVRLGPDGQPIVAGE